MRKLFMPAVITASILVAPGCATDPALVAAGRQFHLAVAPEYLAYVAVDPTLTAEQKESRALSVRLFDEALVIREETLK